MNRCFIILLTVFANKKHITAKDAFPIQEIKHLYAMRWGIETSFRELKYSVTLLHLHSKKVDFIYQEVFAKLIMYNFCQMITQSVVIQQGKKKHAYKVSFSDAVHVCLRFFRGKISPPDVEALLMRYISPIRPGRMLSRKFSPKSSVSFAYRVSWIPLIIAPKPSISSPLTKVSRKSAIQTHCLHEK